MLVGDKCCIWMRETESPVGSLKGLIWHMPTVACVSTFLWSMHQNKLTSWANTYIYNICPWKNLSLCSLEKQSYSCSRNTPIRLQQCFYQLLRQDCHRRQKALIFKTLVCLKSWTFWSPELSEEVEKTHWNNSVSVLFWQCSSGIHHT